MNQAAKTSEAQAAPTIPEPDFVIIGAGAAGGVMAKELSVAGFRVVVLEQGPYLRPKDFTHDEIKILVENYLINDWKSQPNTFRKTPGEKATTKPSVIYGRMVGGGTAHFTGNYWRFHPIDFIERSKKGAIPGTGFADWPITYDELEPYYVKVESEIGVSGLPSANPFDPPRSRNVVQPPLPIKSSGVIAEMAAKKLGWHAYPAPLAILSQARPGRGACIHCGFCEFFGCEVGAKSSTLASVIPIAERTGRCEIRPHSYVRKIEVDPRGRVTGVTYFDAQKREHFQKAKAVIVCANGAETPRLLLMSKSNLFPQGLANSSGLVGKYLMLNGATEITGVFEHPLNDYKSVAPSRVIHDFYELDSKLGFYGGGGIDARFEFTPLAFALFGLPQEKAWWGAELKKLLRTYPRCMNVVSHTTSLALETNSFSLDDEVKDAWGLPALRMTYKDHPDDLKTMAFFVERLHELLDTAGAIQRWGWPVQESNFAFHLLGTCRMGNDPQSSVVNKDHRAHDVPNLFLCDGSSFVSSGRGQPTMTIQALAYRAAEGIVRMARAGELS